MRVLVLGAGFGGLELSTRLSEQLGDDVEVTLIDKAEGFVFGFSKLDVMFGRRTAASVLHRYGDIVRAGRALRPDGHPLDRPRGAPGRDRRRHVRGRRDGGRARRRPAPVGDAGAGRGGPRVLHGGRGVRRPRRAGAFDGGRVVVGVTSTPFKCPPAPSETALLMHDFLTERGLRERSEIALVMPLPVPIPPSPDASKAILEAFAERGIEWHPSHLVRELDPARKVARFDDGTEMPFDLFLGVPRTVCRRSSPSRGCASTAGSRSTR